MQSIISSDLEWPPNADNARIFFEYLMDDYNFDWVTFNFFRAYVKFH